MSQIAREELRVAAERTVLVHVRLPREELDEQDLFSELRALAGTAGAVVVGELTQKRQKPVGSTYLGKGKVQELAELVKMTESTLVIFNNDLSPAQIRNLEPALNCKIIDRSELILDIFARRAATHAAKLQVEIAQLEYTYPRLRAMWDHLGQVVGGAPVGIGTRGPGEQQLEIDRRLAQRRLRQLRQELAAIQARKTREVEQRVLEHYTVGLVGYTNAGKSTLFNRLTAGGAFAHRKLFATLSTRTERWELGGGNAAMLSDTVGFIRALPHHLIASFRSTLEETVAAHLLMIVVDVSDHRAASQHQTVCETLDEIGATTQPRVLILNKVDAVQDPTDLLVWLKDRPDALPLSAASGAGVEELAQTVRRHMVGEIREVRITAPLRDSRAIDFLEKRTEVLERSYNGDRIELRVRIGRRQLDQLLSCGSSVLIDDRPPHEALRAIWSDGAPEVARLPRIAPHERFHPR